MNTNDNAQVAGLLSQVLQLLGATQTEAVPVPRVSPDGKRLARSKGRTAVNTPERLTVDEFCAEMKISRSTFYDWKAKGCAPRCRRLPNRELRIDRVDIEEWYCAQEVAA